MRKALHSFIDPTPTTAGQPALSVLDIVIQRNGSTETKRTHQVQAQEGIREKEPKEKCNRSRMSKINSIFGHAAGPHTNEMYMCGDWVSPSVTVEPALRRESLVLGCSTLLDRAILHIGGREED